MRANPAPAWSRSYSFDTIAKKNKTVGSQNVQVSFSELAHELCCGVP